MMVSVGTLYTLFFDFPYNTGMSTMSDLLAKKVHSDPGRNTTKHGVPSCQAV